MAYSLHKTMFITLLFAFAIPFSLGHRDDSDSETILRDLCSQIERSKECIDLIKSEWSRFEGSNCTDVAGPVIDLARETAQQTRDLILGLEENSNDEKFREKYHSCSRNYDDAISNLDVAKRSFDSNDYQNVPKQVDGIEGELEGCRRDFGEGAFDPGNISYMTEQFLGVYVDLVKVAIHRLLQRNESNYYDDGGYNYGSWYRN